MRKRYLVSYDICESKRLQKVHRKMMGYGNPLQYSVFLCDLSEKEKMIMVSELTELINVVDDSVVIVDLGISEAKRRNRVESIGKPPDLSERSMVVI